MEKKLYMSPLIEVENIGFVGILMGSPNPLPTPPSGPSGAPARGDIIN